MLKVTRRVEPVYPVFKPRSTKDKRNEEQYSQQNNKANSNKRKSR